MAAKMDSAEEKLPPTSAIPESPDPASPAIKTPPSVSSTTHSLRNEIRVWTRDLLIAIGLALVIIVFLYQPVKVEGTSMAPLLTDQERIFINKFVYRFEPIGRGDVVVFWYPLDRSKSFIKRVVGLPEDTVEIRDASVYPSLTFRRNRRIWETWLRSASPAANISLWAIIGPARMIPGSSGPCLD